MVYIDNSLSLCKPVDHFTVMGSSLNSADKSRHRKAASNPNSPKIPACHGSRSAVIDVVILIAVIGASGFLLYPYLKFIFVWLVGAIGTIAHMVKEEACEDPMIYCCIGVGISCSALATWGLVMCLAGQKCGDPKCKGLRKAAEFDIQLETEECVKSSSKSSNLAAKDATRKGLFELPRDHHKELEAELKKMAPPNGRAVLVFKARCGCSVGKLEVPGPRRRRKIK